jgi:hypothetical protein
MKIAFYSILNLAYGGGFEKWVEQVATILSTRGHQIIILTTKYGDNRKQEYSNYCQNARRNALRYDWKITVDKFEQMLNRIVNK